MVLVFKGNLAEGQLNSHYITRIEDGRSQEGFNILALVPPLSAKSNATSLTMIRETKLLLGKCKENFAKVNTAMRINKDILPTIGQTMCVNLVLVCGLFAVVQLEQNTTHPVPFLYKAIIQLCDAVLAPPLCNKVHGKHANLVSIVVIACLDTIFVNGAKETMDPRSIS